MALSLALEAGGFNSARAFLEGRNTPLMSRDINEWMAFARIREEDREERMREARVKSRAEGISKNPRRNR